MMDDLSLLEDFDTHGFEVQMLKDRLNKLLMFKNEEEKVKNRGKGCSLYMSWRIACLKRQELRLMRGAGVRKEIELILKMEKNINAKKAFVQQAEGESSEKRGRINMQIEDLIASSL